jgi:hypothetical protein
MPAVTDRPQTSPRAETGGTPAPGAPAPGSDVPGAPPALARDLTPQDGVVLAPPSRSDLRSDRSLGDDVAVRPSRPDGGSGGGAGGSPYLAAVGLTVAAITICVDTWYRSRRPAGGVRR